MVDGFEARSQRMSAGEKMMLMSCMPGPSLAHHRTGPVLDENPGHDQTSRVGRVVPYQNERQPSTVPTSDQDRLGDDRGTPIGGLGTGNV